jgi:hypothetical protein
MVMCLDLAGAGGDFVLGLEAGNVLKLLQGGRVLPEHSVGVLHLDAVPRTVPAPPGCEGWHERGRGEEARGRRPLVHVGDALAALPFHLFALIAQVVGESGLATPPVHLGEAVVG